MRPTRATPFLEDVLAHVRPGSSAHRLRFYNLTAEQERAFSGHDGRTGKAVLKALIAARALHAQPNQSPNLFPFTEAAVQQIARKLGRPIADKRARALIHRL